LEFSFNSNVDKVYNVLFRAASHQVILFSIYAAMRCTSIVTLINKRTALTTVIQIYSGFV